MKYSIRSLHIYPIKGMAGMSIPSMQLLERGAKYDRRYMLVDENGKFLSQRTHAQLCQFWCDIQDDTLRVYFGDARLELDTTAYSDRKIEVEVWGAQFHAYEVSHSASQWFSDQLGSNCRLVKMVDGEDRIKTFADGETRLSFADGYPYLVLGTASLALLNEKVDQEIPFNRFRANIIVNTASPHEEDSWRAMSIGDAELQIIKACARCVVTTIDQSTAERGVEPLKTLAQYRKTDKKINFGANAVLRKEGVVSVGDAVMPA